MKIVDKTFLTAVLGIGAMFCVSMTCIWIYHIFVVVAKKIWSLP